MSLLPALAMFLSTVATPIRMSSDTIGSFGVVSCRSLLVLGVAFDERASARPVGSPARPAKAIARIRGSCLVEVADHVDQSDGVSALRTYDPIGAAEEASPET
jgi:hypothetical protein